MINVLIPVDFSPTSDNAVDYAVQFKEEFELSITCMNAFSRVKPKTEVKKLLAKYPRKFSIELIEGDLFSGFKDYISYNKVDLIIMGTKGAQGLKKLFLGSNTSKLMLQTSIPILIVPEEAKFESISKILWASDFKPIVNIGALNLLKKIALETDSTVRIAHVKTSDKKTEGKLKMQKSWEDKFFGEEVKHSFKKIRRSTVSKGIRYYLDKKDDNQLLVLVRREYGFLDKLFRKDHTEEFANEPTLPVMIIHE